MRFRALTLEMVDCDSRLHLAEYLMLLLVFCKNLEVIKYIDGLWASHYTVPRSCVTEIDYHDMIHPPHGSADVVRFRDLLFSPCCAVSLHKDSSGRKPLECFPSNKYVLAWPETIRSLKLQPVLC